MVHVPVSKEILLGIKIHHMQMALFQGFTCASRRCRSCTCSLALRSKRSAKVTFFRIFSDGSSTCYVV